MNSKAEDSSHRVIEAAEVALITEGWVPRRTILVAEVLDEMGARLLIGAASEGIATWDLIGMLTQELQIVLRDIDA